MASPPLPRTVDWEAVDSVTGLSLGTKTACQIIDCCLYRELNIFNALKVDNPGISPGEQVEMFCQTMGLEIEVVEDGGRGVCLKTSDGDGAEELEKQGGWKGKGLGRKALRRRLAALFFKR